MPPRTPKRPYHHGDLREALIDAAIELIAERGVHGFSIAEASRRLGVTSGAPYRHYADRDQLLAAAAMRAAGHLAEALADEVDPDAPAAQRLVAAAVAYVRFAAEHRALFQALFGAGLDKTTHPALEDASRPVIAAFVEPAKGLAAAAGELALAVAATAHGHAALLLDGAWGAGDAAVESGTARVRAATMALVAGWPPATDG